ncbi:MAG: hypothetical protein BWY09_02861 [Candidatus Hydrogenedentes bacterium ADurb.Bin179]|nr:MAG: hypothetical protein BWY09_02861 [Candidatus Hydrogenedentes bacterium ADurb.Bin179]
MLNTSTIYQVVYDYLASNEGIENIDALLEKWEATDPAKAMSGTPALITLCAALRDDMRTEANKASGKANIEKAMRAIIKNVPEHQRQLQGAFTSDGKQCVCDGFRAICPNTPLDLPAPPVPCTMDIGRWFADARHNAATPLETPSQGELKSYIKITKAENKAKYGKSASRQCVLWDFGEGRPAVNAVYLLDILTAFPDAAITCGTMTAPLYFSHADGEAILLPVRRND